VGVTGHGREATEMVSHVALLQLESSLRPTGSQHRGETALDNVVCTYLAAGPREKWLALIRFGGVRYWYLRE